MVRRGRGGATHLRGGGLVSAAFRHRTSREADPNLHTHLVTANMTLGPDGRWSALHTTAIYRHGRTAGFVYQSVLRTRTGRPSRRSLRTVGAGGGRGRRDLQEAPAGVQPPPDRDRSGRWPSTACVRPTGAQVATLDSRPAKPEIVDEQMLRQEWRRRAAEVGFTGAVPTGRNRPGRGGRRSARNAAHRAGRHLRPSPGDPGRRRDLHPRTRLRRHPRASRRIPGRFGGRRGRLGLLDDPGDAGARSRCSPPSAGRTCHRCGRSEQR